MRLDALRHWAAHDLPVVVTRQPPAAAGTTAGARATAAPSLVAVGVPAPARWGRCRIALSVPTEGVRDVVAWPTLAAIAGRLPGAVKATLTALDGGLQAALGRAPRVYGSHAWQAISGLPCTRTGSDLDLLLQPRDAAAAAQAVALLQAVAGPGLPRLDGELLFDDGAAVAWREWAAWHDDRARQVLVKRLRSTALETDGLWAAASTATMANSARR